MKRNICFKITKYREYKLFKRDLFHHFIKSKKQRTPIDEKYDRLW